MADLCQDFSNKNNSEGEVIIDSASSINNIKINLQKNIYIPPCSKPACQQKVTYKP